MCETRVLSQRGKVMISVCAECKTVYIWHNNLVLNFTITQLAAFRDFTDHMDFEERSLPFPDGVERAVLRTPDNSINFAFTEDEWIDFRTAINEAIYMQEIYDLLD